MLPNDFNILDIHPPRSQIVYIPPLAGYLTFCMLVIFHAFFKINFLQKMLSGTLSESDGLDPDQG